METPQGLRYAETHEWVRLEGEIATVGITDYAQDSLGDIVYVEGPRTGDQVSRGGEVGTIESVKAASPLYSPVTGTVAGVNGDLEASPELINQDPYGAYIFSVRLDDPKEVEVLLDADAYLKVVERERADQA